MIESILNLDFFFFFYFKFFPLCHTTSKPNTGLTDELIYYYVIPIYSTDSNISNDNRVELSYLGNLNGFQVLFGVYFLFKA